MTQQDTIIKIKVALLLSILFIVTAVVGIQSLKRGFIADDYMLKINASTISIGLMSAEPFSLYNDSSFDLKNHTMASSYVGYRPVVNAWVEFLKWLFPPKDIFPYRLAALLQYLLASWCAYVFFRDMLGQTYPALIAVSIFHFSTLREQNLHLSYLGVQSGLGQLFFCAGIMIFKKFLILYSMPAVTNRIFQTRLILWYTLTLFIAAMGIFSYETYGFMFLGSISLLFIFEDGIYYQKPLLSVKKLKQGMVIFLPYVVMIMAFLLLRMQYKAEVFLKYKNIIFTLGSFEGKLSLVQFISGYIYGILYFIPIPPYLLNKTILLHFQYIIPLLFISVLFAVIWIFIKWKNKDIFIENKYLYLFILFLLLVILNILPLTLEFSPRVAIGYPLFFAGFLTILMRNIRLGNIFMAIYISVSIFSFLQISLNWGKIDKINILGLAEINRNIENHKKYVSFANIEHIGTYPVYSLVSKGFEHAINDSQGKEVHIRVPFFYYFYSFDDFKESKIKIEPLKGVSNNPIFLIRLDGCNCGIKIRNLKQGADEIDYSFGHLKVIEWKPKLNKYQKVSLAREVLFEIKPGFEPLIIPIELLKIDL